jgi:hypothetical protein
MRSEPAWSGDVRRDDVAHGAAADFAAKVAR